MSPMMKALTTLPVFLAFALSGVKGQDLTFFCTETTTCSQKDNSAFFTAMNEVYQGANFELRSLDPFAEKLDLTTDMEMFSPDSPRGIRSNMRVVAALKRSRKKNAAKEIEPVQVYEGDGFTISSVNSDFFYQKFAVGFTPLAEDANDVAVETTENGINDGRALQSRQCCYCNLCQCCSMNGCPGSGCRRRDLFISSLDIEELITAFRDAIDSLIGNEITCLESATQCGILQGA